MKTLKFTAILLLMLCIKTGIAQESKHSLTVIVSNIESNQGTIQVGLYNSKGGFLNKIYQSISTKAKIGSVEVIFKNIPKGEYAISLYHDTDGNQKLNTFLSIPTEPYGISNNVKGRFGPPKWEDAKFSISDKTIVQSIKL
ncbi:hypothetical protein ATO12_15120 [Aquimarina atlantica]|uniref:DUF2141 domain-containing protein n=1 Tax=Aquimarina atlantica TaxID=1317122 RepID=A0A023BW86_9FLAO|nr:DUF2141 domain-containing protein [Aquimarina atlantica]EZH74199.1 hypothetical protein ATO12_15120 [Aquimarina atlantica]